MRLIGLFLSLVLVLLSTSYNFSYVVSVEKNSQKIIEYSFEKKKSDKLSDETKYLSSDTSAIPGKNKSTDMFKNTFYSLGIKNTLYKPPINI